MLSSSLASLAQSVFRAQSNGVIIAGGTADLGVTVTNSAGAGADNLNYSLAAAVQSGIATLGGVAPGSGSLAPGASAANSVSATSTTVGLNTLRFTASDTLASNSPQTADVTLTVLDHAAVVFTDGSGILNLDFGTILVGSGTHSLHYRIQNLPGQYRAGLDMDDITEVSDPAGIFSTNAAGFANLRPGLASSFFDVFLECSARTVRRAVPLFAIGPGRHERLNRRASAYPKRDRECCPRALHPCPSRHRCHRAAGLRLATANNVVARPTAFA